jgi:hypothetical protein
MNVFRHHHISVNEEVIAAADALQTFEKDISERGVRKIRMPLITTESQKVRLARVMIAL